MLRKSLVLVCLQLVSLSGVAQITLPDSLLSVPKAYRYHIVSPDTAQAILSTLRERKMEPAWQLDFAEGDLNFNMRRYDTAVDFYKKIDGIDELSDSTHLQLLLLKRMMDSYDKLHMDNDLVTTVFRLRRLAERSHDKAYEAMSYFTSGKLHHFAGKKDIGYTYCEDALEMMASTDFPGKHIELRNFYGDLVKMYARDGRFDDAMHMSRLQEAEALQADLSIILMATERGLRLTYAIRASMLAKAGKMAEADKAYALWKKTPGDNAIDNNEIFDYLRLRHKDQEALDILTHYRHFLDERGDTVSMRMLSVINREALLRVDMGDYGSVSELGHQIGALIDSLQIRASSGLMQTTYKLLQEQSSSRIKTQWLSTLIIVLVSLLILALVTLFYVRYIRRRNVELIKVLNGLDAYRRAVINGESLTSPKVVAAVEALRSVEMPNSDEADGVEAPDDEDRRLFVEMDKQVTRDRLFLKPGLGRDDLMRLIGVDKNRFGKMMGKYSDASNTSVYVNMKRVEYGAKLLLEQPDYTIATVATECGMSNTVTFNRIFKETYNMTPSEYREKMGAALRAAKQ